MLALPCSALAQHAIELRVTEPAGIRRTEFPAEAHAIEIPQGRLSGLDHIRLRSGGADVPGQFTASDKWPDGSIRSVDVDFNVSIGPGEMRDYRVEYGPDTPPGPAPARGLTVVDGSDSIQVGSVRFGKSGAPLFLSAIYRAEFIGAGPNGLFLVDTAGARHDITDASDVTVEIHKRGPLLVALRYAGRVALDDTHSVRAEILVTMPSSKSWVEVSGRVDDGEGRVKEIGLEVPLAFATHPWTWDLGTANGTYGAFRRADDGVVFTHQSGERTSWTVRTRSAGGEERVYETSPGGGGQPATGWGHVTDTTKVVAFAIRQFDRHGTHTVRIAGDGVTSVAFAAAGAARAKALSVVYHFVAAPVAIGAATSPASILAPLQITRR